ncbi:MetQ/NlpA family ABC transporter substrate-binding protein [Methylobrevis sp. L22]|uniref:MetQ/NlpA family ABC transporter substrate-binding protein n=1 Tax=Methylobrevis albus TaxID=2793297 RepID=A0A931I290_9HYPH|nr:MetQ/NlpA family ABC transporter substrate-binding protein [Methylobrevis albus]
MLRRQLLAGLTAALLAASAFVAVPAASAEPIKLGLASPGPLADPIKVAVEEAKAQGLEVEVIEFTDWIAPNEALQNGDIDVNYYQHVPFLENASAARGYTFQSLGVGTSSKLGLYSSKHKSFDEIPEGGTVAIANDPVNGGRGLVLLEKAGLIKLTPGLDYKATVADITENPKNLKIVEVVAQQLPRTLADVDLAQGYAHFLKDYGLDPDSALLFDPIQQRFALQWVVKSDSPRIDDVKKFVAIYQSSPAVREAITTRFGDLIVPAW